MQYKLWRRKKTETISSRKFSGHFGIFHQSSWELVTRHEGQEGVLKALFTWKEFALNISKFMTRILISGMHQSRERSLEGRATKAVTFKETELLVPTFFHWKPSPQILNVVFERFNWVLSRWQLIDKITFKRQFNTMKGTLLGPSCSFLEFGCQISIAG